MIFLASLPGILALTHTCNLRVSSLEGSAKLSTFLPSLHVSYIIKMTPLLYLLEYTGHHVPSALLALGIVKRQNERAISLRRVAVLLLTQIKQQRSGDTLKLFSTAERV